ncbi:MAG: hypothetical protein ACRD0A_03350 [Acidimicrobiales bacterium]
MADYATLLRDHVTLTCRSVDRIFLQGYMPKLQSVGLVCNFLRWPRGFPIPSSAAFGKIGDAYVAAVHRFAKDNSIPVVHVAKGESKEAFARPLIDAAAAEGGEGKVVLIGIAQEKASVWRSWPSKGQENARHPHMEWGRQMAFVNHFYFYVWDPTGVWRSSRPTGMRRGRSGCGSTATTGPSASVSGPGSATRRSTAASGPAMTRGRCSGSVPGSAPAR